MTKKMGRYVVIGALCLLMPGILGCEANDKKVEAAKPVIAPGPAETAAVGDAATPITPAAAAGQKKEDGIAIEVNGVKLTRAELAAEVEAKLVRLKGQLPPESQEQAKAQIRKGAIDEFVTRTLLTKEIAAKKIGATEKEIADVFDSMKAQLPPGESLEELLKKNGLTTAKMQEEIRLNIQMNKLLQQELGEKGKVSEKEVADYYEKNKKERFTKPESVRARHILIAKSPEDTDRVKADKKAKAQELRKRLLAGANFAELAAKHSDCPSKQNGGDLGSFGRGQMVKPFEEAAFSQQKDVIGDVVETDFGYHIIQVQERQPAQVVSLDGEVRKMITAMLERQKQQGAFDGLMKRLKAKADILIYGN